MSTFNHEVASKLRDIASLLETQHANPFRSRAYHNAADTLEHLDKDVRLIVKHYVNALVGQPFTWSLSHPDREDIPDEVTQIIKDWLDWQKKSPVKKGEDRGSAIACAVTQMLVCDNGDSEGNSSEYA